MANVGRQGFGLDAAQFQAAFARTPNLLPMELITSCVDYFFANLYPTQPIIHRQKVGETIGQMETNVEAYCLVTSLCAYMLIQPNIASSGSIPSSPEAEVPPQSTLPLGITLLHETLRVRKGHDYIESPTVWSVITSFFLFGSYFCLDKHNTAWFHLREATTTAHIIGMHEEQTYKHFDAIESSRRRRLYWLLFVTERAYALQRHRPLSLYASINLPTIDEDPAESIELSGFVHMVTLFRPFDDTFVGFWNKTREGCTTEWLGMLQQQLSDALPTYLQSTETQAVDLQVSQQWLKTMIWQLSISNGFLSSASQNNSMSLAYPIEISRELCAMTSQYSIPAMEVHGIGLVEKLFDIACTLTDVMSCVPLDQYSFELGPRDYLNQLTSVIAKLRGGNQRYFPLLAAKINETLPSTTAAPNMFPLSGPNFAHTSPNGTISHDLYDARSMSQPRSHGSNPTSNDSTPFGSPPRSNSMGMGVNINPSHPPFNFEELNMGGPVASGQQQGANNFGMGMMCEGQSQGYGNPNTVMGAGAGAPSLLQARQAREAFRMGGREGR
ncbi:hypothetical protein MBLNU457_3543t1 [Dothideomycetes sp. NU457]